MDISKRNIISIIINSNISTKYISKNRTVRKLLLENSVPAGVAQENTLLVPYIPRAFRLPVVRAPDGRLVSHRAEIGRGDYGSGGAVEVSRSLRSRERLVATLEVRQRVGEIVERLGQSRLKLIGPRPDKPFVQIHSFFRRRERLRRAAGVGQGLPETVEQTRQERVEGLRALFGKVAIKVGCLSHRSQRVVSFPRPPELVGEAVERGGQVRPELRTCRREPLVEAGRFARGRERLVQASQRRGESRLVAERRRQTRRRRWARRRQRAMEVNRLLRRP